MGLFWGVVSLLILAGIAAFIWARFFEVRWYEVTETDIEIKHLPEAFHGFRIAHISDIHMDSWMTRERFKMIADMVDEQKPDIICITGDFVSYDEEEVIDDLLDSLTDFTAPEGVYAVAGNHDYIANIYKVRQILQKVGIIELSNEVHLLKRGDSEIILAGLDDMDHQQARIDQVIDKLPAKVTPTILMAHEPDIADVVGAYEHFDLQLSGHTHGGQVNIPGYGAFYGPPHGHKYSQGLFDVTDTLQLYVSRGVGTVTMPIRFACRPEISMLTLVPK